MDLLSSAFEYTVSIRNWFAEGEHLKVITDSLIALGTVLLFVATVYLVKATKRLSLIAAEESRARKIQMTAEAWRQLRPALEPLPLDLDHVQKDGDGRYNLTSEQYAALRELEFYSTCVDTGVYDLATFNGLSGGWYIRHYKALRPYVEQQRKDAIDRGHTVPYDGVASLFQRIDKLRKV